jgi:hypothetical protein
MTAMAALRMALIVLSAASTAAMSQTAGSAANGPIACPAVMAHVPSKDEHRGWNVYSNKPLRLSGADLAYTVDSHLEATLDPDRVDRRNDELWSTASVFQLTKHRRKGPFMLVCHYGVHARLSRAVPKQLAECVVLRHGRFGPDEGEFEAACR